MSEQLSLSHVTQPRQTTSIMGLYGPSGAGMLECATKLAGELGTATLVYEPGYCEVEILTEQPVALHTFWTASSTSSRRSSSKSTPFVLIFSLLFDSS